MAKADVHRRIPPGPASEYDPDYCEQAKSFMGQGYSLIAFAASIGYTRETIYKWAAQFPDFSEALNLARHLRALYWEQQGLSLAATDKGNPAMVIFALKNAGMGEWRDRVEVEQQIKVEHTLALDALDSEKLAALVNILHEAKTAPKLIEGEAHEKED